MKTSIVVILDESGSMASKISDVITGFNNFVKEQKQVTDDTARLHLVKFNTVVSVAYQGLDIAEVPELNAMNYRPNGSTALYDAIPIGFALAEEDVADRYVCVVITDGRENASKKTTLDDVKTIIGSHEARGNWTVLYIGEDPEKWAKKTGQSRLNAIRYNLKLPTEHMFVMSTAIRNFRSSSDSQSTDMLSSK